MSLPIIDVDLSLPPDQRWKGLSAHCPAIRELLSAYVRDLGGLDTFRDALLEYRGSNISAEHSAEMDALAEMAGVDPLEVLLGNVYYDAFKHVMGCTAFAIDTHRGPIHARNLDWWTENGALSKHTVVARFRRRDEMLFQAVTWPGFIGTLSGMAPGRFSVTLNAVLSPEPPAIATPVGLLLRELLETADYATAIEQLTQRPLACDCLLLVSGSRAGEMCVVERTPSRGAVRASNSGAIAVTNDYRLLETAHTSSGTASPLQATSCDRYDRALGRISSERPQSEDACYAILDDPALKMGITVQQMVMCCADAWLSARARVP